MWYKWAYGKLQMERRHHASACSFGLDGTAGERFSCSSLPLMSYVALGTIRGPANFPPHAATATLPDCFMSHRCPEASSPNIAAMNSACLLGVELRLLLTKTQQMNWQNTHRWETVVWEVQNVQLK